MNQNFDYQNPLEENLIKQKSIRKSKNAFGMISVFVIGIIIGATTMYLINSRLNHNLNSKKPN